jgi:hypothetical protein
VSCGFSREALALYVEGDLVDEAGAVAARHLATCEECRRLLEELRASQAVVKSLRGETVDLSECTAMRREVMTAINERPGPLGWRLRLERALALGLRPSYGMAAVLLLGVVSVSVLAQMRPATQARSSSAVLEGPDTLVRPEGYREWVLVTDGVAAERVYISPTSYREYAKTGIFPEGTVFVWEASSDGGVSHQSPHASSSALLVSVKDGTKFEGGWGFFDFGAGGTPQAKARMLPESRGCRSCHQQSPLSMGA